MGNVLGPTITSGSRTVRVYIDDAPVPGNGSKPGVNIEGGDATLGIGSTVTIITYSPSTNLLIRSLQVNTNYATLFKILVNSVVQAIVSTNSLKPSFPTVLPTVISAPSGSTVTVTATNQDVAISNIDAVLGFIPA